MTVHGAGAIYCWKDLWIVSGRGWRLQYLAQICLKPTIFLRWATFSGTNRIGSGPVECKAPPKTRETQGNAGNRGHITWFQAMAVFLEASSTTLCSPERCCRGNCWVDMLRFTVFFSWEGTAEGICGSKSILTKTTTDCWTTTETHAERYWQIRIGCVDVLSSWWLNCHWPHSLAFRLPNCWHGILRALAWL